MYEDEKAQEAHRTAWIKAEYEVMGWGKPGKETDEVSD